MARPKIYEERRVATAVRLPASVHAELQRLARSRDVSVNYVITRAVEELLANSPGLEDGTSLSVRTGSMGRSA